MDWLGLGPQEWTAVRLSLKVAFWAVAASLPFGVAVALLLPPVVTGYALLLGFGRQGPFGSFLAEQFGIVFAFRWTGAALAAAVMGFPLMVRAIRLSIESVDRQELHHPDRLRLLPDLQRLHPLQHHDRSAPKLDRDRGG